jgi:hypothetical protein
VRVPTGELIDPTVSFAYASCAILSPTRRGAAGVMKRNKKPIDADFCDVRVRLGKHDHERKLALRAILDPKKAASANTSTVWGQRTILDLVGTYLEALHDGIPRLASGTEPSSATVVASSTRSEPPHQVVELELLLPPVTRAQLDPLVMLLRTGSMTNGTLRAEIEESGVAELDETDHTWEAPRPSAPPFKFTDRSSGAMKKTASLHLMFKSDLDDTSTRDLDRWLQAWVKLVAAGAFFVEGEGTPSYVDLDEIVDPYPEEYVAHFELLAVNEFATGLLLERLGDLHARHPIKQARLI